MADDGEYVMNGEWSFLFWTIFLPYPSSNIHILIFLLVGVVWRLGWIVIGVVEQYCDVSHTVACGGEWTILWGLVTVGLVRRWNAINYQTMPPTTLHRLTNWNQRNNSTIEAIRKDDDDRSFTGNEMGQYWGKGGFDSLKRTQMVLLILLYSISISGWTFSSIFVLSLVTTGNFITEQRKPRTKTSLLRGSLAPTFILKKPAGQSHF